MRTCSQRLDYLTQENIGEKMDKNIDFVGKTGTFNSVMIGDDE